jgi:3-oxoacyl-[acyl-carrier-protein] synthase III
MTRNIQGLFGIEHMVCELPPRRSVFEVAQEAGRDEMVINRLRDGGLSSIPVAASGTLSDLAIAALRRLRSQSDISHVGGFILAHSVPVIAPMNTAVLHDILNAAGMPRIPSVAITGQPCSILHMALRLGGNWLRSCGETDHLLIIGADRAYHPSERFFFGSAMGDSAIAMLISRRCCCNRVLAHYQNTEIIAVAGELSPQEHIARFRERNPLHIRNAIVQCVELAGMSLHELAYIVPHTPYTAIWEAVAKLTGVPIQRFLLDYIGDTGHLNSNDSFAHYERGVREGRIQDGATVLLVNPGFGGTRGCTLICR